MDRDDVTIVAATTAYGQPAVDLLAADVADLKGGEPLAPVTVVVASNYVAVAARRALAARPGGVANVTFLTLHRLAERLGAPALAAEGRRPVSVPVLTAAVRATLADAPGVFAPVADHPATEHALVTAHRELAAVTTSALDAVADCSARAADVVRVSREVRARLSPHWHDETDLLGAATEVVRTRPGVVAELGPVVVHLLHELIVAGGDLLGALAAAGTELRVHVGLTGDADADRGVVAAHTRAGIDVPRTDAISPGCAARIVSASDPDDEVRAAIRLVTEWMHSGVNLGRVALLYGMPDPYARLLHEQLTAAGLPFNGTPVRAIGDLLLGRTLRALLALPERRYRRSDVLAVLTGAPVLDDGQHVHSRAWERISRAAGVVDGDDWDTRLAVYAEGERRKAAEDDAKEDESRAERRRRKADDAERLARFVRRLRADVERGNEASSWGALVAWTHELIAQYIGDAGRRHGWPDEEQDAAYRVEAALDGLAGLDAVGGPRPTVDVFLRTLTGELESSLRRHGRLGDGVLVGPLTMATGLVLDRVAVLGMAEGAFPPRRLEDSLLPDGEREAANGELALRSRRADDDLRHLLAAVACATEAVLCQPRGDLRRSGERPASRWLLRHAARRAGVASLRSGELREHGGSPWMQHIDSFAAGLARASVHASAQELRLAAVARDDRTAALLGEDDTVVAARRVVRERRSNRFTRFDGNLANVAADLGELGVVSASRLQAWAKCPHAFLLQYVLRVEPLDEPERRLAIDPLDVGTLVHDILDTFVKEAIDSGRTVDHWGDEDRTRLLAIAEDKFAEAEARGVTGVPLLWQRDRTRIEADLERFLVEDNRRLAEGIVPLSTERRFDDVAVTLPSGRVVHVRGSVDRIDRAADGTLVVVDYKTGSKSKYKGLGVADPHKRGTLLQPYLYAVATRRELESDGPVWAGYWFTSVERGVERIGYALTPEIEADVGGAIDAIVAGISTGVFPARPSEKPAFTHVDCWFCTPDGLSASERRRDWERKRAAPELAAYLALCEPGGDDG